MIFAIICHHGTCLWTSAQDRSPQWTHSRKAGLHLKGIVHPKNPAVTINSVSPNLGDIFGQKYICTVMLWKGKVSNTIFFVSMSPSPPFFFFFTFGFSPNWVHKRNSKSKDFVNFTYTARESYNENCLRNAKVYTSFYWALVK